MFDFVLCSEMSTQHWCGVDVWFVLQARGLSEVCLQGMETEHTIVTSSSAPSTVTAVAAAPFHYLIHEQAKSIAALQVPTTIRTHLLVCWSVV